MFISRGLIKLKTLDRVVTVKGLSEHVVLADMAVMPIRFTVADNDLAKVFADIEQKNASIIDFFLSRGFKEEDITISAPAIDDRELEDGSSKQAKLRYSGQSDITINSSNVGLVRETAQALSELGKQGIAFASTGYWRRTEYYFTGLNDIKPAMIEEATKNARASALKFAQDSQSKLGKIKSATQGQVTIDDRDSGNPHIKVVRVVATIQYYLSD